MRNIRTKPTEGDLWVFHGEDEDSVYRIDLIRRDWFAPEPEPKFIAEMRMIEGIDPGWKTAYRLESIVSPYWELSCGNGTQLVLFNCPVCDQGNPIPDGDYMCIICRDRVLTDG